MSAAADTRPIVYLGPTLPVAAAEAILDADYRPPVKRGDLPERHDGPILIIDGEFAQSLSVSPNEILRLIDGGTRVVGAASMGALRAAELYRYGMEGCGWIFDQYRSGRIDADDEVAVTYAPDDLQPLTVPLVNVRRWLEQLVGEGELDDVTARRLLARARRLFYGDRTEGRLRQELEAVVGPEELARLLNASGGQITDAKAEDARLVLAATAAGRAEGPGFVEDDEGGGDGG
jgi:TfuA protein